MNLLKKECDTAIRQIGKKIRAFVYQIYWYPYYRYFCNKFGKDNIVICECYVKYGLFSIKKNNWGDDLNKYFFEYCTNKKFFFIPYSKVLLNIDKPCFSLIGSIVGFYDLNQKYIYGSGIMDPLSIIRGIPKKIYSVRGPKTRQILLKAGIDCPENYGDPALLLPIFYQPVNKKHGEIVIIPNTETFENHQTEIENLAIYFKAVIVDLRQYKDWTDVIETIAGASMVISESLHGLIVSETYGVPNVWVELKEHPEYWNFKYEDYYESIEKYNQYSVKLYKGEKLSVIESCVQKWRKGNIDYEKLKSFFPFEYKNS